MINCVSLVERERVEIPRACKERRAAMLRVIQEEEEMYTRPASRWRTLNFNTQPLSELAKAVVMAIRAALNAARWLLPLALVAIIKMHYNPSPPASTTSSSSSVFSLPSCNRFFSFGRRASHLFLFPLLLPLLLRRADRSFGYLLFMSRRTLPLLLRPPSLDLLASTVLLVHRRTLSI